MKLIVAIAYLFGYAHCGFLFPNKPKPEYHFLKIRGKITKRIVFKGRWYIFLKNKAIYRVDYSPNPITKDQILYKI